MLYAVERMIRHVFFEVKGGTIIEVKDYFPSWDAEKIMAEWQRGRPDVNVVWRILEDGNNTGVSTNIPLEEIRKVWIEEWPE